MSLKKLFPSLTWNLTLLQFPVLAWCFLESIWAEICVLFQTEQKYVSRNIVENILPTLLFYLQKLMDDDNLTLQKAWI